MVDLKNLWIGDQLKIISNGRIGHFQGIQGGRALIKMPPNQVLLVEARDLVPYEPQEEVHPLEFDKPQTKLVNLSGLEKVIDLHYEKLPPIGPGATTQHVLEYQIKCLKQYLAKVELAGLKYVTIIHGKGQGILKKEVEHLLKMEKNVKLILPKNSGGALEVYFY